MKYLKFNKLGVLKDSVMWSVEYEGVVYRFNSYIPDDIDTRHFIREHIDELVLYTKYDLEGVYYGNTVSDKLKNKIRNNIDDLFCENDIDIFGYWDVETEEK